MGAINSHSLKIGDYELCPLPTGEFGLDGGAMFGTVPKVLWEKAIPPNEKNQIPMEARALLLKGAQRKILIDCGNGADFVQKHGEKLGSKFEQMYGVNPQGPSLVTSLKRYNVSPAEITDVILTHLHFDHCGGAVSFQDGKLGPTFPNAKYYIQKSNLETAREPNVRERASYLRANFEPLGEAGCLEVLDGPQEEFLPGVSLLVSNGHTQGQQLVRVFDSTQSLVYCGDLIPTSSHIRLAWIMGYDLHPLKLIEEKLELLSMAADQNWSLYFEHDPFCDAAKVARHGSDFTVTERFHLKS